MLDFVVSFFLIQGYDDAVLFFELGIIYNGLCELHLVDDTAARDKTSLAFMDYKGSRRGKLQRERLGKDFIVAV